MKRALPLLAAVIVLAGGVALRPGAETGACAQGSAVVPRADCGATASTAPQACAATTESFRTVRARPVGRGVRLTFARRVARRARIDVFQSSVGRRVVGERLVARFAGRTSGVRWSGRAQRGRRAVRDGILFARFTMRDERGRADERRVTLVRSNGRFRSGPEFYRRTSCGSLTAFKLERPAFGGRGGRALGIAYRLARAGRVTVEVRRAGRLVRRYAAATRTARTTHRLRLAAGRLPRGTYEVRLLFAADQGSLSASLYAQRL